MRLLRNGLIPRVLLGIMGFLTLLLAVGSVQDLVANGLSTNAFLMLLLTVPLALLSFFAAMGIADIGLDR